MSWIVLALAGTALFGAVAMGDKVILSRYMIDPLAYAVVGATIGVGWAVVVLFFVDTDGITLMQFGRLIVPGLLLFGSTIAYMKAMSLGEAPVVVAFTQLTPVFAFFLGFIVLGETLTLLQSLGILLVIASAGALAFVRDRKLLLDVGTAATVRGILRHVLPIMTISCLIRALSDLTMTDAMRVDDLGDEAYWWSRLGIVLGAVLLMVFPQPRRRVVLAVKGLSPRGLLIILLVEALAVLSLFLVALALKIGPLALVTAISSNAAVFAFGYGVLFARVNRAHRGSTPAMKSQWSTAVLIGAMAAGTTVMAIAP